MPHSCSFSGKRWRHINLLLLSLVEELTIVLRRLVLGTLASYGWLSELFVCPLIIARTVLGCTDRASTFLPCAAVGALLDFEISGDLRLDVHVPLGRLPHILLILSVLLDLVDRFLEYESPNELSDLPLIVPFMPELINMLVVDLL